MMSVDILKNCIVRKDGTLVCYDKERGEFWAFKKERLAEDKLTRDDLLKLLTIGKKPTYKGA